MYIQRVDDIVNELVNIDLTPQSQQTFTNDMLIQFMDDALQATIVPLIVSAREEFFVTTYSYLINPVANNALTTIAIPGESAGFRVRDVYAFNPQSGNTAFNWDSAVKCKRFNPDTLPAFSNSLMTPVYLGNAFPQYYIENNQLVFFPNLTQQMLIKMRVMKAPNHLVAYTKCCGQITAKLGSNMVTVDNVPQGTNIPPNLGGSSAGGLGDWTNFSGINATQIDVIQGGGMPFMFRTSVSTGFVLINKSILGVSGATVTLDADTYASVSVGDYIVTNQCSPFVQYVPFECYNLMKQLASMRVLKAQGDLANWSVSAQTYNQYAKDFLNIITPKVESMPKKVGGGNRGGLLGNLGWRRTL